jgi:HK97 family phage major capsid protein
MPLLAAEAAKLSIEDRQRGVIEEIIDKDELFALVPFVKSKDKTYSYVREKTISGGDWYSAYEDIEESAATFDPVSTELKVLAGQVDIDNFMAEVQSEINDQVSIQIAAKAKAVGRQFRNVLVNGDTSANAKQFDGLKKLVVANQTLWAGTHGGAISFEALDELKDAVKLGADCFMMREGTWRAIRAMNHAFGGNVAETVMVENFGHPVRAYDGIPVIINDFLPKNEVRGDSSVTTSVYALRLNEVDGFHGLFGGESAGMRLENVGLLQGRDATRYRIKWYCGAALKATHAIARLGGITNI